MLTFLQANGGTIIALLAVAFVVFLAIRKMVLDKKEGIGICGQKCSQCPKTGHCNETIGAEENAVPEKPQQAACSGACGACPYSAQCHSNN